MVVLREVNGMRITKNTLETRPGPRDWFTGTVFIDPVEAPAING
jgi:hypothetical protein